MDSPLIPYTIGVPVKTADFYGRENTVAWIKSELKNASTHSLLLYGSRAIGKTSLLLQLQTILTANGYSPVYYALAERPLPELLDDLAQRILEQTDSDLPLPESPNAFRSQFLPDIQRKLGLSHRLVLLLDNMDVLPDDHAFWTVVPILTGESPPALVFTSNELPSRLPAKLKSLVKTIPARRLSVLDDAAAIALLYQGVDRLEFTEEATHTILNWTGCHPYFLQLIGHYLWETADKTITVEQTLAETAVVHLLQSSTSDFERLWDALDVAEQLYTSILAEKHQPLDYLDADGVNATLEAQVFRLRPHKLRWSTSDLVERDILSLVREDRYKFMLPLFHGWVRQHKPAILVKAQLDRTLNLEADEQFQVGQNYFTQGQYQQAVASFRQAVGENPYHVGAQLALGTALLAMGFTETAVKRLERAYKLDTVEAQKPLGEALALIAEMHLAASARREALSACEQFFTMGIADPDLQQRVRLVETAVWNQRGDIALQRGFIDKALTAYENASNEEKMAQLKSSHRSAEPVDELEEEAKALMEAEAWSEATAVYEKLLGFTRDASRRASYQKALAQCLEEVELAQYFDEGVKALENKNWLLARMSFMYVITRRMNYIRYGEQAMTLLDQAAKGHSSTSPLVPTAISSSIAASDKEAVEIFAEIESTPPAEMLLTSPPIQRKSPPSNKVAIGGEITPDTVNQVALVECYGKGVILKMVYSPDGRMLALATALGIYFYDAQTLAELRFIETSIPVQAIAFSPNSKIIATGSWHDKVQLWWIESGQLISELEIHHSGIQAVAFSPDGHWLASADEDGLIALWQTDDAKLLRSWEAHRGPITSITFSPDSNRLISSSLDKTIGLWQVESGAQLMSLQQHEDAVTQAVFTPDGQRFFSASRDRTAVLWRTDTTGWARLRRQEVRATRLYSLASHRQAVNDIAISPDGKLVATASADQIVRLWNADNGALLHEFKGHVSSVIAVDFSPDGRTLASSTESLVQFWEVETHYSGQAIEGHMGSLQSVAVSSDGRLMATAVDTRILIWSLENQTLRHILLGHSDLVYHIAFSPQGNILASASADRTARLWNVTTGITTQTLSGHQGAVMDISFSPNGQLLATASEAQTIRLWRTTDGKLLQTLTGHQDAVTSVCFNSTGRLLASGSSDQSVRLWAIPEGRLQQTLTGHNGIIWQVSFSPDDKLLATAALDRTVRLWDIATNSLLHILDAHEGPVWSVRFSPSGQLLLSGASDGKVRIWRASNGALLQVFEEHTAPVSSVTFTPDGERLISASADGTVRVQGLVA